jgi:hypothetical protein
VKEIVMQSNKTFFHVRATSPKSSVVLKMAAIASAFASCALVVSVSHAGTETVFPKASRTLKVVVPPQCKEWTAPLPDQRTNVAFPEDGRGLKGDAALLVRIGAKGEYLGMSDYLASDDAYMRAAESAVKDWTFKPAICNGDAIASDARIDFEFRREGGITYSSGSSLGRK